MYNFKIDVNDKSPVITKEDYGNILLLDFHKDSPFLIHTRYDPFKFSMLSKRGKSLLKTLLEHSNYSISVATIGSNIYKLSFYDFKDRLVKLMKKVKDKKYRWIMFLSTLEEKDPGYNHKILSLQDWSLNHSQLYFVTTPDLICNEFYTYYIIKDKPNFEVEKFAAELAMAFNNKNKSMVEKIADKYDEETHRSMKYNLYSIVKGYEIDEAIRGEGKFYTPKDWKKLLDIIYDTAVDFKNVRKYFPNLEDQEIYIGYNQHYIDINRNMQEGNIYMELFFTKIS